MVPAEQIGRVTNAEVERIFREHGSFVWRTLRRLGLNESDADDLCQEVFVVVHRKLGEFEQRSSMRTWLYGIAVRLAIAHKRRAHVRREKPTDELPDQAASDDPHAQLAEGQARRLLDRALDALDDDKRAVFVLYEIEQVAMADVARAVECPVQTAYSRLHAARDQVQSFLRRTSLTEGRAR
jgi:RNA polymerase sigma-70 factor (ECF subfamily)